MRGSSACTAPPRVTCAIKTTMVQYDVEGNNGVQDGQVRMTMGWYDARRVEVGVRAG